MTIWEFGSAAGPKERKYMEDRRHIKILSPEVIDQISAGEVVERPAHLVKELVENSLDAGATDIEVEIDNGGRQVLVRDNGKGMDRQDLVQCLARHATSKIQVADDLWALSTYGFRGEALASISAVSELSLVSRPTGAAMAQELKCHFGKIADPVEVGGKLGTSVSVDNLFGNTPARLKFLKSDTAEVTQIRLVLKAMALSTHRVSFRIRVKGKLLHFWPESSSLQERAEQVLESKSLFYAEGSEQGIQVKVTFSAPHQVVANNRQIWIFVRGRWVTDRGLMAAVMESYRNLLMHGEYPIVALWVDLPPDEVDVNIHPTKSQVKFLDNSRVFRAVLHVLRSALARSPWLEEILKDQRVREAHLAPSSSFSFSDQELVRTQYSDRENWVRGEQTLQVKEPDHQWIRPETNSFLETRPLSAPERVAFSVMDPPSEQLSPIKEQMAAAQWSSLQILGQARLTYIISQSSESLFLIDQHAAHERVLFETLMNSWNTGRKEVQNFLLPLNLGIEADHLEAIMTRAPDLEKLGIGVEQSGPESLAVNSCPVILNEAGVEKALRWLGEDLVSKGSSFAFDKIVGNFFATMACHSAIRAGQVLSIGEMKNLLKQMDEFPLSSFCPHGRPVFVDYSFRKIEKEFGRLG